MPNLKDSVTRLINVSGRYSVVGALACVLALSGCSDKGDAGKRGRGAPEVGFIVVQPEDVPIQIELPGRITALQTAEVRPQVPGVIMRQLFTEGSLVRQGQALYVIDPELPQAALQQAEANLGAAMAQAEAAEARARRFAPLVREKAIAPQEYEDAVATAKTTKAAVAQQRAALNTARINVRYTQVPAPITGRIGRSLITRGALASTNQNEPLAVISVLDPIFVDIQQSSADILRLRRSLAGGGAVPTDAEVRLILEDGEEYDLPGKVEFSEVTVDPSAGTVTLRARFPNPNGLLLPGMFARARFAQGAQSQAFLVPQNAVSRTPRGEATVWVVDAQNKASIRDVKAERTMGDRWVITQGLKAGDRIITQGLGKLNMSQPSQEVKPVPENQPQTIGTQKAER